MSSPIWTPAALSSELRPHTGRCWRLVEAQHVVSTVKLVDTLDEQALLEGLLEASKPPLPPECQGLDYLLFTPFRYEPPYPHGSRFRRAGRTPGVYYAAERVETAVAELAFYRLLFFAEAPQVPWPDNAAPFTAFCASIATPQALDLTAPPLDGDAATWTHPTAYAPCQELADGARAAGAELIRYQSVRDPDAGANLAVLTCAAFAAPAPVERQTWHIRLGANGVQALCEFPRQRLGFDPAAFAADPRIAGLDWQR